MVAADGTIYIESGKLVTSDGTVWTQADTQVTALDRVGSILPGWPRDFSAWPTGFVVGTDSLLYAYEDLGEDGAVIHHLGIDGEDLPGWPFVTPLRHCRGPAIGRDGELYLGCQDATGQDLQLLALGAAGQLRPGWPVMLRDRALVPLRYGSQVSEQFILNPEWPESRRFLGSIRVDSDGTLVALTSGDGGSELAAYAADGNPEPGWPVSTTTPSGFAPGLEGTLHVWWTEGGAGGRTCNDVTRTVFTILGAEGQTLPGWPRGAKDWASDPVIGPDGTLYYTTERGNTYAMDRHGRVKDGWPISMAVAGGGCWTTTQGPTLGPDGTLYVIGNAANEDAVYAVDPDGRTLPGWPYTPHGSLARRGPPQTPSEARYSPILVSRDGTVYAVLYTTWEEGSAGHVVARQGGRVIALGRDGTLRTGWPYQLPDRTDVEWLAVGNDGRVYVTTTDHQVFALTPDGQLV